MRFLRVFSLLLLASSLGNTAPAELTTGSESKSAGILSPDQVAFFEKNIRPVLASKCYKCHSTEAEKVKGGLLLDTRDGLRAGGDSGPALSPEKAGESLLIKALHYTDKDLSMPPEKSGGKLPEDVIKDFEKWIAMGAPDPRERGAKVVSKEIDWKKAREHWAFRAPKSAEVPKPRDAAWAKSDVDRFILSSLEAKQLHPVADAEPAALLRRISFDLSGLPPSPGEITAFTRACEEGKKTQALTAIVDRLLAAPQFGERWGRHWLDVARYAESTGKERNYTFPTAWRYRNYVIEAVNADKPYDQFIREQIAGDLLPASGVAERNAHLIATAFLALGPKSVNEKNREQFAMDLVDDQIDTTSRAVLGLTVACARCHDHKFDPIPTRDYYAMAGIFRSTDVFYGTNGAKNRNSSSLLALAPVEGAAAPAASQVTTLPTPRPTAPVLAVPSAPTPAGAAGPLHFKNARQAARYASLPPAAQVLMAARLAGASAAEAPGQPDKKRKKKYQEAAPAADTAGVADAQTMGVHDGRIADAPILVRGEVNQRGEKVPRGVVTVLSTGPAVTVSPQASGRLELAQWLSSTENSLTARVAVNRAWQHLFGQGLVRTADNFGTMGSKPTHPELLDFLAVQFMHDGWSLKKLIRSLVLSRTYQLGSASEEEAVAADPDNTLLWRSSPRRLDAEEIRDAMLAASGQLDRTPLEGSVVAQVGDGYIGKGIKPGVFQVDSNKRSVYLPIVRELVPEVLEVFDFAEPSLVTAARDVTNVPAQALFLMNDPFALAQAKAMTKSLLATPLDYAQRISLAYQLTLARPPTEAERRRADEYLRAEAQQLIPVKNGKVPEAATASWNTFCQALFACAEFRYLR